MPSTITTYYTFSPGTKARSSQVNTNFSNYRGDLLPINEATVSASDDVHHLGAPDHRWNTTYTRQIDFTTSTSTASLIMKGDTSATAGAFAWTIEGTEVARLTPSGFSSSSVVNTAFQLTGVTITSSQQWTVPAGVVNIIVRYAGGGGGGGGGGGAGSGVGGGSEAGLGGGGGAGVVPQTAYLAVTAGDILSITIGVGGSGGAGGTFEGGGTSGTVGSPGGSGGTTYIVGTNVNLIAYGADGGSGGALYAASSVPAGGSGYATTTWCYIGEPCVGGVGGSSGAFSNAGASGGAGYVSYLYATPAAGGAGGPNAGAGLRSSGGGGGGGSSTKAGGAGGNGGANSGGAPAATNGSNGSYGSGGGGGGGSGARSGLGGNGGNGGDGYVEIYYIKR